MKGREANSDTIAVVNPKAMMMMIMLVMIMELVCVSFVMSRLKIGFFLNFTKKRRVSFEMVILLS